MKSFSQYYEQRKQALDEGLSFGNQDFSGFKAQTIPPPNRVDDMGQDSLLPEAPFDTDTDVEKLSQIEREIGLLDGEIIRNGGKPTAEQQAKLDDLKAKAKDLRSAFASNVSMRRDRDDPKGKL